MKAGSPRDAANWLPAETPSTIGDVETDVRNKVRQTHVPRTRPLMPLFEAIVNSIQAIEDANEARGVIKIEIVRRLELHDGEQAPLAYELPPVSGFIIRDNGIGFTDTNFRSFYRAESSYKLERGGKGVGRFLWLAAFREVRVNSVYRNGSESRKRTFKFSQDVEGGVEELENVVVDSKEPTYSQVELVDISDRVAALRTFPNEGSRIARAIIEHFIGYLLKPACPQIELKDGTEITHLNEMFRTWSDAQMSSTFKIGNHEFSMVIFRATPPSGDTPHRVRLCGDRREVKRYSLAEDIPQLPKRPQLDGHRWIADVYVSGSYLDKNVDTERARFHFEEVDAETETMLPDTVSMASLRRVIASEVSRLLHDLIEPDQKRWKQEVRDYVQKKSPRYGALLHTSSKELESLPIGLAPDRLEAELARLLYQHRQTIEVEIERQLAAKRPIADTVRKLARQIQDVQRNELAEYVLRRHSVLAYLNKALGKQPKTGNWPVEALLHDVIFPRKNSLETIDPEMANLWILDERLSTGEEILSDLPIDFNDATSPKPDLVVYDRTVAVADGGRHPRSVIVFEFKRPGRDDYSRASGKDPVAQLQEQVGRLRSGPITTPAGRNRLIDDAVPIDAYLIAESTPTLQRHLKSTGWIPSPDMQSHVLLDMGNRVVYRHITWTELLENASQRNRAFFERLGLPTPA